MKKMIIASLLIATHAWADPQIIAHRGGTADAPENTLPAIALALENHAQAIWITVQLSRDGVPVLYRPSDLSALTTAQGKVSRYTQAELATFNAGAKWKENVAGATIPTLKAVLERWPETPFYIDIKSPDADSAEMGKQLLTVLKETNSLKRVRVYSTEDRYLDALPVEIPRFVSRSETRTRLANISLNHVCQTPAKKMEAYWYGLELNRKVEVVEKFTLGEGVSPATLTWDKEAMDCFRSQGNGHIILLGVNSAEDYQKAKALGADGVMVDSPAQAREWLK
ncbi:MULTISPECIES: glycerophosphodiester phosphodiesterase family protein [unclassified Leclercia]|uniref:Glycerophosphodiester phosphodiesterase n=1 Tax=Leclercia barmai TaxID=2785629 RepID=A0ABS7S0S8_9ENTR|nr:MULTISPECIES: glycerophosphodiester phosphodiesterase family protein [unclassified Leclercia]MBZ0060160.1 glycerophosphodiester phosphodiesterase [Leclercia sp. EMC7]MCM5702588.1 glycerophosphodiester phosphodiesterase [Leclercia sp. LTM14]